VALTALLIDDHELFLEAIRWSLEQGGMDVVGTATNVSDGFDACIKAQPDVALIDLNLPDGDGIELGKKILDTGTRTKVIAVTASDEPGRVKEALRIGFSGYISKTTSLARFVDAIESAMNGHVVIPQRSARAVAGAMSAEAEQADLLVKQLTRREVDVLRMLVRGASSIEIARELTVSPNTVRSHVQNVLTKLQVHSRLEAAAFAVHNGVVKTNGYRSAV
jgi:two-component system, NarL family, nitrate/nitrite response regulator NarL